MHSVRAFTWFFCFLMLAAAIPLAAEPTGEREWTSTAGTRLTAVAIATTTPG